MTAEQELLCAENMPLTTFFACKYRHCGIEFDDLCQIASLGLVKAATNYDPSKGSFGAFASSCIPKEILHEISRVHRQRRFAPLVVSLEEPTSLTSDQRLMDALEDNAEPLEKNIENSILADHAMSLLNKRHRYILSLYCSGETQVSIAKAMGCTNKNVSGIYNRACARLRKRLADAA